MIVIPGTTDVTTYFKLVDPTTGAPETGLTITDLDVTYVRDRAAAVKSDATALGSVTAAHTDNAAIEVDPTNAPGLYRVDWPDAAFATGSDRVQLIVNGAAIDPAFIEADLRDDLTIGPLVATTQPGNRLTSPLTLEMFQHETKAFDFTITDSDSNTISMVGKTMRLVVQTDEKDLPGNESVSAVFKVEDGAITKTSTTVTVTVDGSLAATARSDLQFRLWNVTDDQVVAHGPFAIVPAMEDAV